MRTLTTITTPELFTFTDRLAHGGSTIMPRFDELALDPIVLTFAAGAALVTGILCSVAPVLAVLGEGKSQRVSPATPTAVSARVTDGHRRLASLLVVGQLTLATTLLIGAGLLIRSFLKLATLNPGYDSTNVLTFQVVLEEGGEPARKLAWPTSSPRVFADVRRSKRSGSSTRRHSHCCRCHSASSCRPAALWNR